MISYMLKLTIAKRLRQNNSWFSIYWKLECLDTMVSLTIFFASTQTDSIK